jgi:hypothetical protein
VRIADETSRRIVCHFMLKHAAWRKQIELWLSKHL